MKRTLALLLTSILLLVAPAVTVYRLRATTLHPAPTAAQEVRPNRTTLVTVQVVNTTEAPSEQSALKALPAHTLHPLLSTSAALAAALGAVLALAAAPRLFRGSRGALEGSIEKLRATRTLLLASTAFSLAAASLSAAADTPLFLPLSATAAALSTALYVRAYRVEKKVKATLLS